MNFFDDTNNGLNPITKFFIFLSPAIAISLYLFFRSRVHTLYGTIEQHASQKEIILTYSPTELTTTDLFVLILHLLLKYVPFYDAPKLKPKDDGFDLPPVKLYGPLKVTESDVALFRTAVKLSHAQSEATNPFLLVALTTPLLITTLTHPASPIKPLGAVNTRNRLMFHNPHLCSSESDLIQASKTGQLVYTSSMGGPDHAGRRKKRGVEIDIMITVEYHGKAILTQELSFLQFLSKSAKPVYKEMGKDDGQNLEGLQDVGITTTSDMTVPKDGPWLYAKSSKDYNPIHISSLFAKAFGFKSSIAHGNHVAALLVQDAIDALPGILEEKAEGEKNGRETSTEPQEEVARWLVPKEKRAEKRVLDIAFVKPVTPLPAEMRLVWVDGTARNGGTRVEFMAEMGGKTCVAGSIA